MWKDYLEDGCYSGGGRDGGGKEKLEMERMKRKMVEMGRIEEEMGEVNDEISGNGDSKKGEVEIGGGKSIMSGREMDGKDGGMGIVGDGWMEGWRGMKDMKDEEDIEEFERDLLTAWLASVEFTLIFFLFFIYLYF